MKYWKYVARFVFAFWGLVSLLNLFGGSSTFATTVFVYFFILFSIWYLNKTNKLPGKLGLSLLVFFMMLFFSEIFLRYVLKKHVTYSELGSGRYVSHYTYYRSINFRFLIWEGRKDLKTLEFKPGEKRDNFGDNICYPDEICNRLGTRGELPPKGKRVVYVMGDSFAEGAGAPIDSTYPVMLQNNLRKIDQNYAVLNLGVTGFDIFQEWNMFVKHYNLYKPKEAFFLVNTTNIGEVMTRGGKERFLPDGSLKYEEGPWWEPFYAVSFVFRLFIHSVYNLDWFLLKPEEYSIRHNRALEKIKDLVANEMSPWANKNGVSINLVLQPMVHELYEKESMYTELSQTLENIYGVKICDSRSYLAEMARYEKLYWEIDKHFRPLGYTQLAKFTTGNCLPSH